MATQWAYYAVLKGCPSKRSGALDALDHTMAPSQNVLFAIACYYLLHVSIQYLALHEMSRATNATASSDVHSHFM